MSLPYNDIGGVILNPLPYIPILILLLVLFLMLRTQKTLLAKIRNKKRKQEDNTPMTELAKRFIDQECIIYSFNGNQFAGTIKEVNNGAVLIENGNTLEAINLDFVVRIREYPRNKKGKKKSVVLD